MGSSIRDYLRRLFSPPTPTGKPLNLTESQVNHLHAARQAPEFDAWLDALDAALTLKTEALLASQDAFQQSRLAGHCNGLREAARLIDEILTKEKHADAEPRKQHRQPSRERSPAERRIATFGSPAWSAAANK